VLVLSLVALAATLAAAVARPRWAPEPAVAAGGALVVVAAGALSVHDAWDTVKELAPTVGLLGALLVLADGCRRHGLFEALGAAMAMRAGGSSRRLLALVFAAAAAVTAVLSLDATVVLLTPVVFATAARARTSARPHVYACSHLANSASLLLPVSNLTNLLAFHAANVSFAHFAALMAVPWFVVLGVEWTVFTRVFGDELAASGAAPERPHQPPPRFALGALIATLAGFVGTSPIGLAPFWVALAGAVAINVRRPATPSELAGSAEPAFLVFVLGLGVIVAAAGAHGLGSAARSLLPDGDGLGDLLGVAAVAAVLANLVNNLPATLILTPVAAASGTGPLLAMLVGVNVGPNLTYTGSLATLLWRRVVRAEDADVELGAFLRLGALTVPAGIVLATVALWLAVQGFG